MVRKVGQLLSRGPRTWLVRRKRSVLAVWTGLILAGILPSGHFDCVHLEGRWTLAIPQ